MLYGSLKTGCFGTDNVFINMLNREQAITLLDNLDLLSSVLGIIIFFERTVS